VTTAIRLTRKHEAETVGGDVHSGEDCWLSRLLGYVQPSIKVLASLYNPSATYPIWKRRTSHMESVTFPPFLRACSQAMLMSMRTQRISPGRNSLNDLISKEPIDGLSSRPIKNCRLKLGPHVRRRLSLQKVYIVDHVPGVTAKGELLSLSEGGEVDIHGLQDGIEESCGAESDPTVIEERE
jgi:hypothetical protein